MNDEDKPYRPPISGGTRYAALDKAKHEITTRKELFSLNITASTQQKGEHMGNNKQQVLETESENPFVIDFTFKPMEPGLKLRREETQLLLAYIGEILAEIEAEEQAMTQQAASSNMKETV